MFERYTANSKRAIFYSRYEACHLGSPRIGTEHLLLGLMREDSALLTRFLDPQSIATIPAEIERQAVRQHVELTADVPLTQESQRVLSYGTEEAARYGDLQVGTGHLLIGLMREPMTRAARLLGERGLHISMLRDSLRTNSSS
jgi:ATP-dependent Clp protease ATP-binding subunit ClpC